MGPGLEFHLSPTPKLIILMNLDYFLVIPNQNSYMTLSRKLRQKESEKKVTQRLESVDIPRRGWRKI